MSLVDAARLTALRARTSDALLTQTATIYQRTLADDGEGGKTETWSTVRAADVACLVSRHDESEDQVEGGKAVNPTLWRIRFLSNQTVAETDRILIGTRYFAVVGTAEVGTLAVVNRVICRRII